MENYVKEVSEYKGNFLLINKSDLLSEEVRKEWNRYFLSQNVNHIFFSALIEQEKIDSDALEEQEPEDNYENTYQIANRHILVQTLKRIATHLKENNKEFCVWKNGIKSFTVKILPVLTPN